MNRSMVKLKIVSITGNMGGTLRPDGFYVSEPEVDFPSEEALIAVFVGSQLIDQASVREKRHVCAMLPRTPALPNEPQIEVKKPWGMGECSKGMTLDRYSMLVVSS